MKLLDSRRREMRSTLWRLNVRGAPPRDVRTNGAMEVGGVVVQSVRQPIAACVVWRGARALNLCPPRATIRSSDIAQP